MRAMPVLDPVRLAVDDPDRLVIDPERVGADLCHDRLNALTDRGGPCHDLDPSGRVDAHANAVGRAEAALLDEDRETEADELSGCLAPVHGSSQIVPTDV